MKRLKLSAIIAAIIMIALLFTSYNFYQNVYADNNYSADVTLTSNSTVLEPNKTYTLTARVGNIQTDNKGINALDFIVEYDPDVFEEVKQADFRAADGWSDRMYKSSTHKLSISTEIGTKIYDGETSDILTLTVKTKSTVSANSTTIKFKTIRLTGGVETVADGTGIFEADDAPVTFLKSTPAQDPDPDPVKADAVVVKALKKNSTTPISGVKIALCNSEGTVTNGTELTTNANGQVDFATVRDLTAGTYYYKETSVPTEYVLNTAVFSFTVDAEGNVTFNSESRDVIYTEEKQQEVTPDPDPVKATSVVVKKFKAGTTTPIAGVKIALCDEEGNIVKGNNGQDAILTTDSEGKVDFATIKDLTQGTYYYKETQAVEGYKLNTSRFTFTVDAEGNVSFARNSTRDIIYNEQEEQPVEQPKKAESVIIKKYATGTTTVIPGVKIALCDSEGNVIKGKNGQNAVLTTDKNGEVNFAAIKDLTEGTYYYKELEVVEGYKLNTSRFTFTVDAQGVVSFAKNPTRNIIYNDVEEKPEEQPKKADTVVVKAIKKGTSTPIKGVKIALCDEKGNALKGKDGKEIILTTDSNGKVDFAKVKDLTQGTYYYKEVEVPEGYEVNSNLFTFMVAKDGKVTYGEGAANGTIYTSEKAKAEEPAKKEDKVLPHAGASDIALGAMAIVALVGVVNFIRYRKM